MTEIACPALPVTGTTVAVATIGDLKAALLAAAPGTTILVADGTYNVDATLELTAGVTVRSQSGDASKVVLDGGFVTIPVVRLSGSGSQLISVSVEHSGGEGVQVEPRSSDQTDALLYDVSFVDNLVYALRIRPQNAMVATGPYTDNGTVACSRFITTGSTGCDPGSGAWAVNADAARGWTVRNNLFDHRSCPFAPSVTRTVQFDSGSRDTIVSGNTFLDTNFGILFGGQPTGRTYPDPLPAACMGTSDHRGGLICNNVFSAPSPPPSASEDFAEGIALWHACDSYVMHNTIASPAGETFSNVEYRFSDTYVHLINNFTTQAPLQRDLGTQDDAWASSNQTVTSFAQFVDPAPGDLRPAAGETFPTGADISGLGACTHDVLGRPRDLVSPTVGAFEP
jgi:hypothetical protein